MLRMEFSDLPARDLSKHRMQLLLILGLQRLRKCQAHPWGPSAHLLESLEPSAQPSLGRAHIFVHLSLFRTGWKFSKEVFL